MFVACQHQKLCRSQVSLYRSIATDSGRVPNRENILQPKSAPLRFRVLLGGKPGMPFILTCWPALEARLDRDDGQKDNIENGMSMSSFFEIK